LEDIFGHNAVRWCGYILKINANRNSQKVLNVKLKRKDGKNRLGNMSHRRNKMESKCEERGFGGLGRHTDGDGATK
jgi:hypothetical protein